MTIPVRMIWGEADPWEPLQEALLWQRSFDCIQDLQVLKGVGHCPHDEDPARVNPLLLHWLELGWAAGAEPNP
jgi:pimeloyl-ACP methyl ester carboxylesterase